jgi:penicillin-binding protein 1A
MISIRNLANRLTMGRNLSLLEKSVIVLEDRRFFSHQGYDLRSLAREIFKAITFRKHGGASTIDIQLFRTASKRYERTLRRKIRELIAARALQYKFSKLEILRAYLEIAYFGTNLTGAFAASREMFNKAPDDLDPDEASFVASMLVYPRPRVPTPDWEAKVRRRAQYGRLLLVSQEQNFNQIKG